MMKLLTLLMMASWLCIASASIDINNTAVIIGEKGDCAALLESVYFFDQSNTQTPSNIYLTISESDSSFNCSSNTSQTLTIGFSNNTGYNNEMISDLTLEFQLSANQLYWELSSSYITLGSDNNNTVPLIYMGAPYGMETPVDYSFVCTRTVFLLNTGAKKGPSSRINFYIEKFQLQPVNLEQLNETDYKFGSVNYCQGFFSSGIWMAISASLLLTFILAFGVSLLFNVRPLDRFDDPKGKPLNIGAEK